MTVVARFEIHHTACLDRDGRPRDELPPCAGDRDALAGLYRLMHLTRAFDAKAVALARTGQLGTFASSRGQEAIGVAIGTAMRPEDVLVPSYREHGAQIARGVSLTEMLAYWGGDERGSDFAGPRQDFPLCIPIATQCCHGVGVAVAFRNRAEPRVAVITCGDGATSKGDFYEALNLAGAWRLPVVFVVSDNQWAISMPRNAQTAAETLAQKAIAAGFDGEQADGNDVLAMRLVLDRALERARSAGGPTLIEALTYRIADHTTADDATRYRDADEVAAHAEADPLRRLRLYLEATGGWSESDEAGLAQRCSDEVERAAEDYKTLTPPGPEAMFDHLHAELPAALASQRRAALDEAGDDG